MLNHGFSSILLGNYSVGAFLAFIVKVSKNHQKCMPKWLPKCSKIELGGALGEIFEILGGFQSVSFFDKFWACEKCVQNRPKWRHLGAQGCFGCFSAKGRRQRRSSWEGFFARFYKFWDNFLQNNSTRLAPPSKDGVGGFEGLRPTRRPNNTKNTKI